ncbi:MAG: hypothetical protein ACE5JU_23835, partial [Candidatus Binatia bacterium]
MSPPTKSTENLSESRAPKHSPFLDETSFAVEEPELAQEQTERPIPPDTPFVSMYQLEGQEDMVGPEAEEFASFVAELYDPNDDEIIFELVNEAANLYETRYEGEFGGLPAQRMEAERLLEEHFAPLLREVETLLEAIA